MDAYYTISFSGFSMNPSLKPGDRLVVKRVPPESYRVGDIVVRPNFENVYMVHRLIKLLPDARGLTKGDALLVSDPDPVPIAALAGRIEMVIRDRRLIPLTSGPRAILNGCYALLSRMRLTSGAIRLRVKKAFSGPLKAPEPSQIPSAKQMVIAMLQGHIGKLPPDVSWRRLNEVAQREGLAGIVYHYLKNKKLPADVQAELENSYQAIAAQNIIHLEALNRLEEALCEEKLEVMTLKGASLLQNVYPSVGLRPMEDLDLMVRTGDLTRFSKLLHRQGYRQNQKLANSFIKNPVIIDLHTHALNIQRIRSRSQLFPEGMKPIWQASIPWATGFRWLRRPDDIDNILLLSQHYLKHYYSRLIWLEDIHRLLAKREQKVIHDLIERARQLQQTKPLAYTLYFLEKIYHVPLPAHPTAQTLKDNISAVERFLMNLSIRERPSELLAVIMALFCIDGLKNRIGFGWENLFPRAAVMQNEFGGLTGTRRAVLYPLRFFQALRSALRFISAAVKTGYHKIL